MKKEEVLNLLENDSLNETKELVTKKSTVNVGRTSGMIAEDPRFPKLP